MIEKELEDAIIALLSARLEGTQSIPSGILVTGSWSQVPDGDAKGTEKPEHSVVIAVAVGAPEWDQYLSPICSIPVALTVSVRHELAPTGAELSAVMQPISTILMGLQADVTNVDEISCESFQADGVRLDGGSAPRFDRETNIWTLTRSFIVRGTVAG